jgi:hypothetical protein
MTGSVRQVIFVLLVSSGCAESTPRGTGNDQQRVQTQEREIAVAPVATSEAGSASVESSNTGQPCEDAYRGPGGCKAGFWAPTRQVCFKEIESACRCICNGSYRSCKRPPTDPNLPPGPVTPIVEC